MMLNTAWFFREFGNCELGLDYSDLFFKDSHVLIGLEH